MCVIYNRRKVANYWLLALLISIAHPREIFREAVRTSAARVVLGHNHPSGNPLPSQNDLEFTERVRECGAMMGIELLDHIIVGETKYFSLREEKYLK
ncbi:DNA repair protein [Enterococcus asini]|nr:DNA repair protein [Enterococcus asini]